MKKFAFALLAVLALALTGARAAEETMKMPEPQKEHQWLAQLVGEWDAETEAVMEPGKPPVKSKGTESVKSVGGFWVMGENKGMMMDQPFTGILTLGYDVQKKKYVGTWIDSMTHMMWTYDGSVDGKTLTLNTEGPCPMQGGKIAKMRETLEVVDKDHKVFKSSILGEDGKWMTMLTVNYQRKK